MPKGESGTGKETGWLSKWAFQTDALTADAIGYQAMQPGYVQPYHMYRKSVTALSDAAATLTAAQMVGGIFTITPTAGRALTTDTAANIVAAISGAQVGTTFEFTIQVLAAFAATLTAGAGITLSGNHAPNNISQTFLALLTNVTSGSEAVTIYSKDA